MSTNASNVEGRSARWLERWEGFADGATNRLLDRVFGPQKDLEREIERQTSDNGFSRFIKENWQAIAITVVGGAVAIWLAKKLLK
jgi:hypothetical protein